MSSELEKIYDEIDRLSEEFDENVEELASDIRGIIEPVLSEIYNDEESREAFFDQLLIDDDALIEELVDKLALLNIYMQIEGGEKAEFEKIYLSMVDTYLELSKTVDPLTGFCKQRLTAALDLIKDFEKRYWPVSTLITAENASAFREFMPEIQYENILAGRRYGIGALRHVGDDLFAAGAIVYDVLPADEDAVPVINIEWINVHEDMRQTGVGNFLMAQVLEVALENEGSIVTTQQPVQEPKNDIEDYNLGILYAFLDSWKFEFELNTGSTFVVRIGDLEGNKYFEGNTSGVYPLRALGEHGQKLVADFLKNAPEGTTGDVEKLPYDYFDKDLSCVILDGKRIKALFLLTKFPSGNIKYELLKTSDPQHPADLLKLIAFAYEAGAKFEEDAMFFGSFLSEEGFGLAKKILPEAKVPLVQTGYLIPQKNVVTEENWDQLRKQAGLSDEKIPEEEFALSDEAMTDEEYNTLKEFLTGRKAV